MISESIQKQDDDVLLKCVVYLTKNTRKFLQQSRCFRAVTGTGSDCHVSRQYTSGWE